MNSVIVWILSIKLAGFSCAGGVQIKFPTEQACEAAKSGVKMNGYREVLSAECVPAKEKNK